MRQTTNCAVVIGYAVSKEDVEEWWTGLVTWDSEQAKTHIYACDYDRTCIDRERAAKLKSWKFWWSWRKERRYTRKGNDNAFRNNCDSQFV